jgi:hypothetical protein
MESIIENITFGIEIETCFHILDMDLSKIDFKPQRNDYFTLEDEKNNYAISIYLQCMKEKEYIDSYGIEWNTNDEYKSENKYDKWSVTHDISIDCSKEKITCIKEGHKTNVKKCQSLSFYPIEIITPKLKGKIGLQTFMYVWYGYIMSNNIVYTSNRTQGLHINLSHPNMNKNGFLNLWASYEPIIIQLLPLYRRLAIDIYAAPISNLDKKLYLNNGKFFSVRKGEDRMEVRIGEGSIDFFDVYFWNLFCIILFAISIVKESNLLDYKTIFDYSTNEGKIKAFHSLLDIIQDDGIQRMLLERYRKNKERKWPNITYTPSKINLIQHPWKIIPEHTQKMIYDLRYVYCNNKKK